MCCYEITFKRQNTVGYVLIDDTTQISFQPSGVKPKPKLSLWPITKETDNTIIQ